MLVVHNDPGSGISEISDGKVGGGCKPSSRGSVLVVIADCRCRIGDWDVPSQVFVIGSAVEKSLLKLKLLKIQLFTICLEFTHLSQYDS